MDVNEYKKVYDEIKTSEKIDKKKIKSENDLRSRIKEKFIALSLTVTKL